MVYGEYVIELDTLYCLKWLLISCENKSYDCYEFIALAVDFDMTDSTGNAHEPGLF